MIWKLFLDDIRKPDDGFILAVSVEEAIALIERNGFPVFISFDHDLGESVPSGKDFVNFIVEKVLDKEWEIPERFNFEVHSDNSVGAENIRVLMNNILRHEGNDFELVRRSPYSSR